MSGFGAPGANTIGVALALNERPYTQGLSAATQATQKFEQDVKQSTQGVSQSTEGMSSSTQASLRNAGMAMTMLGAVAAGVFGKMANDYFAGTDAIISATGKTGAELAAMTDQMRDIGTEVPVSLGQIGKTLGELSARSQLTGKDLGDVALRLAELDHLGKAPTIESFAKAMESWQVATHDQAGELEYLNKVAEATGVPIGTLTDLLTSAGPSMRGFGLDIRDAAVFLGAFQKEGVPAMAMVAGFRRELASIGRDGGDAKTTLMALFEQMRNAGSAAEASAIAADHFGARASALGDAIYSGRVKLEDLTAAIDANHTSIKQETVETMHFTDQMKVLWNTVEGSLGPWAEVLAITGAVFGVIGGGILLYTRLSAAVVGLSAAQGEAGMSMAAFSLQAASAAGVVAGLVIAYQQLQAAENDAAGALAGPIASALQNAYKEDLPHLETHLGHVREEIRKLRDEANSTVNPVGRMEKNNAAEELENNLLKPMEAMRAEAETLSRATGKSIEETLHWVEGQHAAGHSFATNTELINAYTHAVQTHTTATDADAQATAEDNQHRKAAAASYFGVIDAARGFRDAQIAVVDAHRAEDAATRQVASAQRSYEASLRGIVDAERSYQQALRSIVDAQRSYEAAQRSVTDAQRSYEAAQRAAVDAEDRRIDSMRKVEDAIRGVTDAQLRLDDALDPNRATMGVDRAQLRLDQAQAAYAKGGFSSDFDRRQAELDLREAQIALEDAQRAAARAVPDAQRSLDQANLGLDAANKSVTQADQAVADAQYGIVTAAQRVSDAVYAEQAAWIKIGDARYAAQQAAQKIVDARQASVDAAQAVADAVYNQEAAHRKAKDAEDAVLPAALKLNDAQRDLNALLQTTTGQDGMQLLQQQLGDLPGQYDAVTAAIGRLQTQSGGSTTAPTPTAGMSAQDIQQRVDTALRMLGTQQQVDTALRSLGIQLPNHAAGGYAPAGQLALFGEQGPELAVPTSDMHVFTAAQTAGMGGEWDRNTSTWWRNLTNSWAWNGWVGSGETPDFAKGYVNTFQTAGDMMRAGGWRSDGVHIGSGAFSITVQAPNYVGSQADLGAAITRAIEPQLHNVVRMLAIREASIKGAG